MPETLIGGQFVSISKYGVELFESGRISTGIGGIVVELASAPIPPGEYRLEIEAGIGGIEIYLPRYVKYTIEGGPGIGGTEVHDGLDLWTKLTNKVRSALHLPLEIPDHAVAEADPEHPVKIHFVIDGMVGGLDVYRL
ncbi:MAG TPA: LiaF domain-containing protein [Byssovorax sp.]|jgi:hypothetical protein